jgi:hypothetical protein
LRKGNNNMQTTTNDHAQDWDRWDYTMLIESETLTGRAWVYTVRGNKVVEVDNSSFRGVGSAVAARVWLKSTPTGWVPFITCLRFGDGREVTEAERFTLQEAAVWVLNESEESDS